MSNTEPRAQFLVHEPRFNHLLEYFRESQSLKNPNKMISIKFMKKKKN